MNRYQVNIRGEYTDDDGLRVEIPVDENDFWGNLQSGTCPDCGGHWIWAENGHVPGTRRCVGQSIGTDSKGEPIYSRDGGCGSFFTVLGARYDDDGGRDAKRRHVAVLRRERNY